MYSRDDTDAASGVYFLYQGAELTYVGESGNIFKRIATHVKDARIEFDTFEFYFERKRDVRKNLEQVLIGYFNPRFNRVGLQGPADERRLVKPCFHRWHLVDPEVYYPAVDTAFFLNIPCGTLRRWVHEGKAPASRKRNMAREFKGRDILDFMLTDHPAEKAFQRRQKAWRPPTDWAA